MRRVIYLTIIIILCGCVSIVSAQTTYELRGSLREWAKVFTQSPRETDMLQSQLKLELLSSQGKKTAFKSLIYYIYDGMKKEGVWDAKEAYVDYYSDLIDVRFGKQIIAWGKADEMNPTDILNPQNLSNITEDKSIRKIGLTELKADMKLYGFVLTGVWKPEFEPMQISKPGSRWFFFAIPGITSLPQPTYPENKLENTEWTLKLSRTISSFDFSASYFDGWDNIFTPKLAFDPINKKMALDKLIFNRTKMLGADFAGSIASVGIWGECAYFQTEDGDGVDPLIKNPYFQYVIGADYTFGYDIKANIQYIQEIITKTDNDTEKKAEERVISKLGIGIPIQQGITLRIEKKFGEGEAHKIELFGIYDVKNTGILFVPKLTISPEDAFNIEIGANIFNGESESIFWKFTHNDEVYLKCTYSF